MPQPSSLPALSPGLHLVHKPVGPTSFSLVQQAHAELAARPGRRLKLCHGGTLDPFASGLLVLLVGGATRLFERLHALPKIYEATLALGVETDTGDPGGRVVAQGPVPEALDAAALSAALDRFVGWHEQVPPSTSAKKLGGEPAYRKAHRGEAVSLPPSRVYLHQAEVRALRRVGEHASGPTAVVATETAAVADGRDSVAAGTDSRASSDGAVASGRLAGPAGVTHLASVRLVVRGGFYVRALARELGRAMGVPMHLAALHRSAIGPFVDPGPGRREARHGAEVLPWCPTRALLDHELGDVRASRAIPVGALQAPAWAVPDGFPPPEPLVAALHRGTLAALLREASGALHRVDDFPGGL